MTGLTSVADSLADLMPSQDVQENEPTASTKTPQPSQSDGWLATYRRHLGTIHGVTLVLLLGLLVAVIVTSCLLTSSHYKLRHSTGARPRNVIFMLSDGFGPASQTLARSVHMTQLPEHVQDRYLPGLAPLPLDDILLGTIRTSSRDSLVTDSAAGATAYSCGRKAKNGVYGASQQTNYGTLLEAAKRQGFRTGIVVTSSITHATPAAFTAHGFNREDENMIATWQMSGKPFDNGRPVVDLYFGGGLCHFLPQNVNMTDTASCRTDDVDLLQQAQSQLGYTVLTTRAEFDGLSPHQTTLPLLGLFGAEHLEYEIEREPAVQASLSEMVAKALHLLTAAPSVHGDEASAPFFLFIEGSRIDMAAHENDAPSHAIEAIEYNRAVQVAKDWVAGHPDTLLVSTSDHETGGLSLGRRTEPEYWKYPYPYKYVPLVFRDIKRSAVSVARDLVTCARALGLSSLNRDEPAMATARRQLELLVLDAMRLVYGLGQLRPDQLERIVFTATLPDDSANVHHAFYRVARVIGDAVSGQADISWATPGHTGVDVNLYGMGAGVEFLNSCMENTDVHFVIKDLLQLDTDAVTALLRAHRTPPAASSSSSPDHPPQQASPKVVKPY